VRLSPGYANACARLASFHIVCPNFLYVPTLQEMLRSSGPLAKRILKATEEEKAILKSPSVPVTLMMGSVEMEYKAVYGRSVDLLDHLLGGRRLSTPSTPCPYTVFIGKVSIRSLCFQFSKYSTPSRTSYSGIVLRMAWFIRSCVLLI
jgi:hypothetical protein